MNSQSFLFEAKTTYDQNAYRALVQLMLRRLRRWPRLAVLSLGFLTLAAAAYRLFTAPSFDVVAVVLLIFGNALIIFSAFAEYFLVQMLGAETGKKHPLINRYRFFESFLEIAPSCGDSSQIPYEQISRILDYKGYLFLFVGGRSAYILSPRSITKGTEEKLRDFLNQKLSARQNASIC